MKAGAARRLLAFLPPKVAAIEGGRGSLSAATVVGYGSVDASGRQCLTGDAPLSLLPEALAVDLLFDVSDMFAAVIDAPRLPEGRLRQALPGLVEEQLCTETADCHLAYHIEGTVENSMRVAVGAIDRVTLTRALEAATEAGFRPRNAYSALYAIPAPADGTLSVRVSRGRGTVRTGEHSGFAFRVGKGTLSALLIAVVQLGIKRIHAYGCDAAKLLPLAPRLRVEIIKLKRDFDAPSIANAVNLLQGPFAPAGRFGMPALEALARNGQLRPVVTWTAIWLAIFIMGLNAYRFSLDSETYALRSAMQTAFRSAFPSEPPVEPVAQTQRHLRELRARAGQFSPDDFSVLNAKAAQLLANAPVGALAGIEYRDAALTLKFKPNAAGSAGLQNALRAQALQQGLDVRFDADGSAQIAATTP